MVQDRKVIAISGKTARRLIEKQKIDETKKSLTEYIDAYLQLHLDHDEFLEKYAPNISKIGITDNTLFLKDHKKNKVIEIRWINNMLQSNDDDLTYLQFALAIPEISKITP